MWLNINAFDRFDRLDCVMSLKDIDGSFDLALIDFLFVVHSHTLTTASIPTVVFPSGLGVAAGPQMQGPPGMGSQAAVPVTGQPQLFIPQLPYPSGSRGSRHDSRFRYIVI